MSVATAQEGPELVEISTEQLGFQIALSNEDKVRLLPEPWPTNNEPPPSASLLSVASRKGLVAAAGPRSLVVAKTESVRNMFINHQPATDRVRKFQPEATLEVPRVNQVAFTSDEKYLIIAAETGGGLAVYDVDGITNGRTQPDFQIGTNNVRVRHLLPNPNSSENTAHVVALVLDEGQLLLANLKERKLVNAANQTPVFHENVASACWSKLGKQIVAGRNDATAVQIDPQGNIKGEIPVPPGLAAAVDSRALAQPLLSIYWLETNEFLLVHTPVNPPPDPQRPRGVSAPTDDSIFHIATRENPRSTHWTFRRVIDPTPPFIDGGRVPANYFIQRLRDWPPNIDDMLFIVSTLSDSVGAMTKAKAPLARDNPVTGTFTATTPIDTRRATMPMSIMSTGMEIMDTSPIGMAVDLSVQERVKRPIPEDEMLEESSGPVPALWVLNNEGVLGMWYIIYRDSIKQQTTYPDLVAAGGPRPADSATQKSATPAQAPRQSAFGASPFGAASTPSGTPQSASQTPSQPAFGKPAFGQPAFGQPSAPAFGQPSAPGFGQSSAPSFGQPSTPAFGQPSTPAFGQPSTPAFGNASALGGRQSIWGSESGAASVSPVAKQQPVFGSASSLGNSGLVSGFGQLGATGQKTSPWSAQNNTSSQNNSAFGGNQSSPSNQMQLSSFANPTSSEKHLKTATSFGGNASNASPFAQSAAFGASSFLGNTASKEISAPQGGKTDTIEESMDEEKPSEPAKAEPPKQARGILGSTTPFKLESSFKGDGNASKGEGSDKDEPKPTGSPQFSFGSAFGQSLDAKPTQKETDKDESKSKDVPLAGDSAVPTKMPSRFKGDLPPVDVPEPVKSERAKTPPPKSVKPEGTKSRSSAPEQARTPATERSKSPDAPLVGSPPTDLAKDALELQGPPEDDWDDEPGGDTEENTSAPSQSASPGTEPESTTPATQKKPKSFTPAGLPPAYFSPPQQESPHSPSPQRPQSAGQPRKQSLKRSQYSTPNLPRPARIEVPPGLPEQDEEDEEEEEEDREPTEGELQDEEDARIRELLSREPEMTKDMPPFLAHQGYLDSTEKPGIGGQIEKVYRDINSMLDTFGLNAHALKGFVEGHTHLTDPLREIDDDGWVLGEIGALSDMLDQTNERLEINTLPNVPETLSNLKTQTSNLQALHLRISEIRKQIRLTQDAKQGEAYLPLSFTAPLPAETQTQQSELRHSMQKAQSLLAKLEELMTILRADLSSPKNNSTCQPPTIEAVRNTILKMTTMIEHKSGDIDLLEAQIKRLPPGALLLQEEYEDELVEGLKATKLPPSSGRKGDHALGLSAMLRTSGREMRGETLRASMRGSMRRETLRGSLRGEVVPGPLRGSLRSSMRNALVAPPAEDEVETLQKRRERRKKVLEQLREKLEGCSDRVVKAT
ncbi:hypothetical protein K470DRAFT_256135 [Piedraia hortae CBS 480.64]|uniref:Nucleoporin Nup159/Nup146 N-terminal domain-containing protein n=1 Tax=Piedraia hortae CBS 480.64 TaxID=1314780 RepID=A0A6A7C3V6_9PEZI|nr:hypothetical protein K470DRAFT_256135 [Piedraia hortae CBS 480.64]